LKDFLSTQPQIQQKFVEGIPTAQLHMYEIGKDKSSETLFASYVPVSMVKELLSDKNLLNNGYADL
jgi:hypothetical protein